MRHARETREDEFDHDAAFERSSGVFRRVAPVDPSPGAEDIAQAAQAVTRTWAAVLLAPAFGQTSRASVVPAPAREKGSPLVLRLSTWLREAGGGAPFAIDVPAYVQKWMPIERALVLPIQALSVLGWIAVPRVGTTRDAVRCLEAIASGFALDLERAERRARITALSAEHGSIAARR